MYTQNLLHLFMKIFSIVVHKILYFKDINISSNTSKWQCIAGFEIVLYCKFWEIYSLLLFSLFNSAWRRSHQSKDADCYHSLWTEPRWTRLYIMRTQSKLDSYVIFYQCHLTINLAMTSLISLLAAFVKNSYHFQTFRGFFFCWWNGKKYSACW